MGISTQNKPKTKYPRKALSYGPGSILRPPYNNNYDKVNLVNCLEFLVWF